MYLLDTNVVSELRKARSGWSNPHVADFHPLGVPVLKPWQPVEARG